MKKARVILAFVGLGLTACLADVPASATEDAVPWYLGASGGMLLPGTGNTLSRAAEVSVRAGWMFGGDMQALELEALCAPNVSTHAGGEALSGVGIRHLYHLNGIDEFDKLFGCERFDPFVTYGAAVRFGAEHAFADRSHRTSLGPTAGIGALYHLTNNLDLRFDAQTMLGVDSPCGLLFSVVIGLQWTFGGSVE